MEEIWNPIVGYEGWYSVSNKGSIRRDKSGRGICKSGRILKPQSDKDGYMTISLHKNNIRKTKKIHILVANSFIGECKTNQEVNHKDGIKKNNFLDNLEYLTKSENIIHAYNNGLKKNGQNHFKSKLKNEDVYLIRKMHGTGRVTYKALAIWFNVKIATIQHIVNRINWKHLK